MPPLQLSALFLLSLGPCPTGLWAWDTDSLPTLPSGTPLPSVSLALAMGIFSRSFYWPSSLPPQALGTRSLLLPRLFLSINPLPSDCFL